jgi:thiamine-phosphate pyrophosphorylase
LLLYYITDRKQFAGDDATRETALLDKIAEAARCGIDFIQLREKDLSGRELEALAYAVVRAVRDSCSAESGRSATRILINSRTDVAIACAADGVHLTSMDIDPSIVRSLWPGDAGAPSTVSGRARPREKGPIVTLSCHSEQEVACAASSSADFAVFAPVFEKRDSPHVRPAGLETLRDVCRQNIPVIALGGVTVENARQCIRAGAAGIAGIRLFQENDIASLVRQLRD